MLRDTADGLGRAGAGRRGEDFVSEIAELDKGGVDSGSRHFRGEVMGIEAMGDGFGGGVG